MHAPEFLCSFYTPPKAWDGSSHQAGLSYVQRPRGNPVFVSSLTRKIPTTILWFKLIWRSPWLFYQNFEWCPALRGCIPKAMPPSRPSGSSSGGHPQARTEVQGRPTIRINLKRTQTFHWPGPHKISSETQAQCLSERQIKKCQRYTRL